MAIDTSVPRSRRALLAGGLGGMAALVAAALGRPLPTDATDGDTVHVGQYHTGANSTMFDTGSTGAAAIVGQSSAGTGVYGSSSSWRGVYGYSDSDFGVYGYSDSYVAVAGTSWATAKPAIVGLAEGDNTGVLGWSGATSVVPVTPPRTGVYGYAAQDTSSVGVGGETTAGTGVRGETESGTGVAGLCDTGIGVLGHGQTGIGVSGSSSYDIGIDGWSGATTKAAIVGASAGIPTSK